MVTIAASFVEMGRPSMKVPPKRKGNSSWHGQKLLRTASLNESPSEKEGKSQRSPLTATVCRPSMKVPPKRKGNPNLMTGR